MLPQGKKSTVTVETTECGIAVRKSYNDNGDPAAKCAREVAFYRWYEALGAIPRLLECKCPTSILVERLTGTPLSDWQQGKSDATVASVSTQHGSNVAAMLQHALPEDVRSQILCEFPGEASLRSMAGATLEIVQAHVDNNPDFDIPEIREALLAARRVLDVGGFWGEEVLCKLDWNAGNTIVDGDTISGYIDFEQAFLGNRLIFIGTVIDHINILSWPNVVMGLQEPGIVVLPAAQQYAAACFSMCYKIRGCCRDGEITFFTPQRLVSKFQSMKRMIEEAEQSHAETTSETAPSAASEASDA